MCTTHRSQLLILSQPLYQNTATNHAWMDWVSSNVVGLSSILIEFVLGGLGDSREDEWL